MKKQHTIINQQQTTLEQQQSIIEDLVVTTENMHAAIICLQSQMQQFIEQSKRIENPA
jgi:hypothetical protein